jgi:peptidoglycan/LPS O-acetylase OafA/YrhL
VNGTEASGSKGRSVWAVVAGLIVIFILSMGMDGIMHATGIFPAYGQAMSDGLFAWATAYRVISSIIGCYVTARLAPNRPLAHALWLGWVGVLISTIATIATWNKGPVFGPHWYPIALVLVSLPCAWIGGKLYQRQRQLKSTS